MLPLVAGALLVLFAGAGSISALGEPTLATDKADYAPGETVHVTGGGFAPGNYALPVKRPDGSIVKGDGSFTPGWDAVTVGLTGTFNYDYNLNGIEGTYEVRAYPATWSGDWSQTPIASTTFTDAPRITAKDHEGQSKILGIPAGYTNGNVTEYSEGDPINFRFTLEANEASTGLLNVRYTENDGTCLFFDGSFSLGTHNGSAPATEPISGATPTVFVASGPTAVDSGTSSAEWVVTLSISFGGAGTARLNYFLRLSNEAGECNGASQHSRLQAAGGDVAQTGAQNVPVPANQVVERPEITVSKVIDRDGNGTFESTAAAGEYCFRLDGGTCVSTNSSGQVLFTNVTPDGPHTVTEEQVDFSQGTYQFDSGTGTNCVFIGSTATATVASGNTAINASCTFRNKKGDKLPSITVEKTASPTSVSEPGGDVTYTVTVTNTSPEPEAVTLTSLVDNRFGNLDKDDVGNHTWTTSSCDTGGTIAISGSYTCTFTAQVSGSAGLHTNTVTATADDDEGNEATASGSATVTITDVAPTITVEKTAAPGTRPEPGGSFTFSVKVTNTSSFEPGTLTTLVDDIYGNLDKDDIAGHSWTTSTCDTGGEILPGGSYECSFVGNFIGNAGDTQTDTVTATVTDDEGSTAGAQGSATVGLTDVAPTVEVTKDASPESVPESGGTVTFTITATNTSFESVTLTALVDDKFGDLNGQGSCTTGGTIGPGDTYSCSFSEVLSGEPGSPHTNTTTATVTDNDGSTDDDSDSASVAFTDVKPTVEVTKDASPESVPESGGTVTFTIEVRNTSFESVTLTALSDDKFGDLNSQGSCAVPQTLAPNATYSCSFTASLSGEPDEPHTNTTTATVTDNDGSTGTGSDSASVAFTDVKPTVEVTKDASPESVPESGGTVTFTITATNTSFEPVTLTALSDDKFGDLNGQGDCAVPQTLAPGASYSCSFTVLLSGEPAEPHTNTTTATVEDNDGSTGTGSDSATVGFTDVLPTVEVTKDASPQSVPESGGTVTFTITATNTSFEPVTLTALSDNRFGDLNGQGSCSVPQTLAPNASYSCSFSVLLSGEPDEPHTNTTTATVEDNDGSTGTGSDSATVGFTDVEPTVTVEKTANPNTVPESGGTVTFTIAAQNTSFEPVTLTALSDDKFGDLNGQGSCSVPQTLAPGASYSCSFSVSLSGEPGSPHTNTTTATVEDNDGSTGTGSDSAAVSFTDVLPTVEVTKDASPESVPESGGTVTFTITVKNTSFEPVTLTALVDDRFGDLNGQGSCSVPQTLAPGASYSCSFSVLLSGEPDEPHTNTTTATVEDNDDSTGTGSDSATVTFTDIEPTVGVTKDAAPESVPESGGTVTFTITVTNTSFEPVTLTALSDDKFGDLNGQGDCAVPQTLGPGASYSCSFTVLLSGEPAEPHTNTTTATVKDNDGSTGTGSDSATVGFTDVLPTVEVTKDASPESVPESGGTVTFTITVTNTSFETVTLTNLVDDKFGNLDKDDFSLHAWTTSTCDTGGQLEPSNVGPDDSYTCTFTAFLSGEPATPHHNTTTATVEDNDGSIGTGSGSATVTFTDVAPTVEVTKHADKASVSESGDTVTFTITVENTSFEPVTITELTDDKFGDLSLRGTCATALGTTLAPGATYSCSFSVFLTGEPGEPHTNTTTATVEDNDGSTGTGSGSATVGFTDVEPTVTVEKTANPNTVPESGGTVTFTITATNTSFEPVTLTALSDDKFGDLNGQGSCSVPQTLAPGASYSCSFSVLLSGEPAEPHTNTTTATVEDNDGSTGTGSDSATVTFTDVEPTVEVTKDASPESVPESGGTVTFTITVKNTSFEPVTLTTLTDDKFGDLNGQGDCAVPQTLGPGASYSCSFTVLLSGEPAEPHTNTTTATVEDNDGSTGTGSDSATVTFTDVEPTVEVTKDASPESVPESGGTVTFTITVKNTSFEPVTLTTLTDDKFGDLNGNGSCSVPQALAPGATYTCSFTVSLSGEPGSPHTNTTTATVRDNDNSTGTGSDSATVTFTDVAPTITVDKTASPRSVNEPGGTVTFSIAVTNTSFEAVTLTALNDDKFGNLFVRGTCTTGTGTTVAPGATYSCSFDAVVTGNGNTTHTNTATATVRDNDLTEANASDSAMVMIADVKPTIEVTKTASPSTIFEPAASVTFTVTVKNTSLETVTLVSLTDDKFGDLNGRGTCSTPQTLAPGATYSCSFTALITGAGGTTHTNTVTATVTDDEGNRVSASASASVTILALPGGMAKMTGGGQIVPSDGKVASFGLIAQFKHGASSGHFNYLNHTTDLHLNGPVTLIYNVNPATHTLSFRGTSSKNNCTFDVTVTDNGEPGTRGPDRFSLTTNCAAPNQAANAPLTKGNLQWHPTQG